MPRIPAGERSAAGGRHETQRSGGGRSPHGTRVAAGALVGSGLADAIVGLLAIETAIGAGFLGAAVAQCSLALGCYHRQRWAYRWTIGLQTALLAPTLLLGQFVLLAWKVALVGYCLASRDVGWH